MTINDCRTCRYNLNGCNGDDRAADWIGSVWAKAEKSGKGPAFDIHGIPKAAPDKSCPAWEQKQAPAVVRRRRG